MLSRTASGRRVKPKDGPGLRCTVEAVRDGHPLGKDLEEGARAVLPIHPGAWRDAVNSGRRVHAALRHRFAPHLNKHSPPPPPHPESPESPGDALNAEDTPGLLGRLNGAWKQSRDGGGGGGGGGDDEKATTPPTRNGYDEWMERRRRASLLPDGTETRGERWLSADEQAVAAGARWGPLSMQLTQNTIHACMFAPAQKFSNAPLQRNDRV